MDNISWESIDPCLLRECYDLAAQYETLDTAKAVLLEKSKRVAISDIDEMMREDRFYHESPMQIVSDIINGLTQEKAETNENNRYKYFRLTNKLPNSPEKEYIFALLSLWGESSERQRIETLEHISAALAGSPDDPRYIALAKILQETDN